MAAPSYKSGTNGGTDAGTSVGLVVPTVVAGDLILVHVCAGSAGITVTPPAGFSRVPRMGGHTGFNRNYSYYKVSDGTESASTVTFSFSASGAYALALSVYQGVNTKTPFGSASPSGNGGGAGTTTVPNGYAPVSDCLLVYMGGVKAGQDETATAFSGGAAANWTRRDVRHQTTTNPNAIIADDSANAAVRTPSGAGTCSWVVTGSSGFSGGVTVALVPATQTTPFFVAASTGANGASTQTALQIDSGVTTNGGPTICFLPGMVLHGQWEVNSETAVFSSPTVIDAPKAMSLNGSTFPHPGAPTLEVQAAVVQLTEADCYKTAETGVQITSNTSVNWSGVLHVIGGLSTSYSVIDLQRNSDGGNTTTPDPPQVACGNYSAILVYCNGTGGGSGTETASTGYTISATRKNTSLNSMRSVGEWKILGAGQTTENPGTLTTGSDNHINTTVSIGDPPSCVPPTNDGGSHAPSISGTVEVGQTLTADHGIWSGDATMVFTYQWQRCCGTFPCTNIAGATGTTYVVTVDDVGCSIRVEVTADNGCNPNGVADSAQTIVVPEPPTIPVNTVAPVISGIPQVGQVLTTTNGTWTGGGTITFAYQWEMNCDGGTVWDTLVGQTASTLLLTGLMVGCQVRCVVSATNTAGTASADSNAITVQANIPAAVEICEAPPWRFVITDLDCGIITWLERLARSRTVTYVLNAPAIATGTVPSDDPRVNILHTDGDPYLAEGNRLLFGFRLEPQSPTVSAWIVRYAGIVLQVEDAAQQDNADTAYTAFDPWQYLRSRPLRNGPTFGYTLPGVDGSSYTATRIDVIAREILRNTIVTDGPVFIDAGASYGGTAFWGGTVEACDQIDINFPQGTNVGDAWDELVGSNQADFVLTPIWDPIRRPGYTHELSIFRQAGAIVGDTIFGWDKVPRNLIGVSRLLEGSGRANKVKFYAGQGGTAPGGQVIPVQTDATSVAKYGEYWGFQFFPGGNVAAAVEALAAAQLDIRKNGRQTVVMSPSPDCSTALFQAFFVGDRVPVYASDRLRSTLTGYQRIYGIPISIADDSTETIERMLASKEGVV